MNATRVLVAQHQAIAALFDDVAQDARHHAKARVVARIAEELIAHMAGEEAVFYPAARRALGEAGAEGDEGEIATRGCDEHVTLRVELRRVLATNVAEASFEERLAALRSLFERHVREEEQDLFPRVERALAADALEQLGADVLASRPPIWIVTSEGHPMPHAEETLRMNARVSLPIPPAHH
jgi:hemerythrin superfamily protein